MASSRAHLAMRCNLCSYHPQRLTRRHAVSPPPASAAPPPFPLCVTLPPHHPPSQPVRASDLASESALSSRNATQQQPRILRRQPAGPHVVNTPASRFPRNLVPQMIMSHSVPRNWSCGSFSASEPCFEDVPPTPTTTRGRTNSKTRGGVGTPAQRPRARSPQPRAVCHAALSSSPLDQSQSDRRLVKFCSQCGSPTVRTVPEGDDKERDVCGSQACAAVHYDNPKVVVGAVCRWGSQLLLCRRAIEPCVGLWGFPQGFMELGESTREGTEREAREEAGARIEIRDLLAIYNIPNQVQIIYLADLISPEFHPGSESLEVQLFEADNIPFDELAFPTVRWALEYYLSLGLDTDSFAPQQRTKVLRIDESGKYVPGLYIDQ